MIPRETVWQFMRFSAVGVFGAVAHYGVLILAVEAAGLSAVVGSMLGAVSGAAVNYALARLFVFRTRRSHVSAIPRFFLTAAGSAALNGAAMALLVPGLGLPYLPAQVAVTGVLVLVNYVASRRFTFSDPGPRPLARAAARTPSGAGRGRGWDGCGAPKGRGGP